MASLGYSVQLLPVPLGGFSVWLFSVGWGVPVLVRYSLSVAPALFYPGYSSPFPPPSAQALSDSVFNSPIPGVFVGASSTQASFDSGYNSPMPPPTAQALFGLGFNSLIPPPASQAFFVLGSDTSIVLAPISVDHYLVLANLCVFPTSAGYFYSLFFVSLTLFFGGVALV